MAYDIDFAASDRTHADIVRRLPEAMCHYFFGSGMGEKLLSV
jgi:hypothetical protein